MVTKITILRTGEGATISVVSGDHVYSAAYDSWDQALHDVIGLHSWTQKLAHVPAQAAYAKPSPVRQDLSTLV